MSEKDVQSEFLYMSTEVIQVDEQVRTVFDTQSDSFTGLVDSVREMGILEPLLVKKQKDGKYLLLAGERRYRAALILELKTVPVRIMGNVATEENILAVQLIENIQREDLDPIDEALAYYRYFKIRMGDIDLNGLMNSLMTYERDPKRLQSNFTGIVPVLKKISGKSTSSIKRCLSLLRLPEEIQANIKSGTIGKTQGYIFAENIGSPNLLEVYHSVLKKPITNKALKTRLNIEKKVRKKRVEAPVKKHLKTLSRIENWIDETKKPITLEEADKILDKLRHLYDVIDTYKEGGAFISDTSEDDGGFPEEDASSEAGTTQNSDHILLDPAIIDEDKNI